MSHQINTLRHFIVLGNYISYNFIFKMFVVFDFTYFNYIFSINKIRNSFLCFIYK